MYTHKLIYELPCMGLHCMKAFPVVLAGQVQTAMWLTTWHKAFNPHVLIQGSTQCCLTHALSIGQSELIVHSGRHSKYGSPWYSGWQEQTPSLQTAFGPHGDGLQGSVGANSANYSKIVEIHIKKSCYEIKIT